MYIYIYLSASLADQFLLGHVGFQMRQSFSKWKSNKLAIKPHHFTMFWSTKYNKLKATTGKYFVVFYLNAFDVFSKEVVGFLSFSFNCKTFTAMYRLFLHLLKLIKKSILQMTRIFTYINVFSQLTSQRFPWVYCTSSMLNCFCILKIEFLAFHN